jgi:hypothetical protein
MEGDSERAARLLGAAGGQATPFSAPTDPASRADYERTLAAVRAGLSEEGFAAAWAEGQAMTLEQAVAYASEDPAEA